MVAFALTLTRNFCVCLLFIIFWNSFDLGAVNLHPNELINNENRSGDIRTPHRLIALHGDIREDASISLHFLDHPERIIRYSEVILDDAVTKTGKLHNNELLLINLFDDVEILVEIMRVGTNVNNTYTIAAKSPGGGTYVAMATTGDRSLITVFVPVTGMFYKIISDADTRQHFLVEMNESDRGIIKSGPPVVPEISSEDIREQERIRHYVEERDYGPDDLARIGVMVVYTTAANQWAETSGGGMDNVVALSMVKAQMTLDNSNTHTVMELVYSDEVNYQESSSAFMDLMCLTNGIDELHIVSEWREEHGADLVAMFGQIADVAGLAWILTNRYGLPSRAFSLTRVETAAVSYVHIHEMGHNMGLHHHPDQNYQPGPTEWSNWPENRWSAGWRWTGTDGGHYCSVMSYSSGSFYDDGISHSTRPYFSNPDITHAGVAAGHVQRANNASTVRELRHVIAAYQPVNKLTVLTNETDSIRAFVATSGGTVVDNGGLEITHRGIVWNTTGYPDLQNYEGKVEIGAGNDSYTARVAGLEPLTTYHVRAYVMAGNETDYGHTRKFKTKPAFNPEVETSDVGIIGHTWAKVGGNVVFDGNSDVTQRGVVWCTQPYPTLINNTGISNDGQGEGVFSSHITALKPETKYYYRAYASNFSDTSYGETFLFTTMLARVYPVPADNILHVEFHNNNDKEMHIQLINTAGMVVKKRTVYGKGDYFETFLLHQLPSGMYYLKIEGGDEFPVWPVLISPKH